MSVLSNSPEFPPILGGSENWESKHWRGFQPDSSLNSLCVSPSTSCKNAHLQKIAGSSFSRWCVCVYGGELSTEISRKPNSGAGFRVLGPIENRGNPGRTETPGGAAGRPSCNFPRADFCEWRVGPAGMTAHERPTESLLGLAAAGARDSTLARAARARWLVQQLRYFGFDVCADEHETWLVTPRPLDRESRALWHELRTEVHSVLLADQAGEPRRLSDHPAFSPAGDLL